MRTKLPILLLPHSLVLGVPLWAACAPPGPSDSNTEGSSKSAEIVALDVRVAAGTDDAEQQGAGGMYLDSGDLELIADGNTHVGFRFTGIDIPKGAVIESAWVQFVADESQSTTTSVSIRGQLATNASTFSTSTNNISSRALTSASTTWAPTAWTTGGAGSAQKTADIGNVIEEIVGQSGWVPGNALVLVMQGTGHRTAEAYEGGSSQAALLHIEYSTDASTSVEARPLASSDDAEQQLAGVMYLDSTDLELGTADNNTHVGLRFPGLAIPPGATVNNAWVQFTADESQSTSTSVRIRGEKSANAASFSSATNNISSRALTSASTTWAPTAWTTGGAGSAQKTTDISDLIEEVVGQSSWASGNALVLVMDGTGHRAAESYEGGASIAPLLHVEFTAGDEPPTDTGEPPADTGDCETSASAEARASASGDDAEQSSSGGVSLNSTDLEIIADGNVWVGVRFPGVAIPDGATVDSAWIQFTADESQSTATSVQIRGEKSASAASFTTSSNNVSSRAPTSSSATWAPTAWTAGQAGSAQKTVDLKGLVQEVVDQSGWNSGNAMAFLFQGSGHRTAESWDGSTSAAPLLHVDYTVPCGDTDTDTDTDADTGSGTTPGHFFPDAAPWYNKVTSVPVDPNSDYMIDALQDAGWGNDVFQVDFSIEVLHTDSSSVRRSFSKTSSWYDPDCDSDPVPLPTGGNLEGESGYDCTTGGDCHLIVAAWDTMELFEMYKADVNSSTSFSGGCLVVWNMAEAPPDNMRGDQCTSSDAAGYPVAPMLFTADEVASGYIDHAIRFALPNASIRDGEYYHPASHATNSSGGGDEAIPYGARLRLKPDFDMSRIEDPDARVVVKAMQEYGMYLADGGSITLMGAADTHSDHKYRDLFEDYTHAFFGIEPQDFEVLELEGDPIPLTYDCVRNGY